MKKVLMITKVLNKVVGNTVVKDTTVVADNNGTLEYKRTRLVHESAIYTVNPTTQEVERKVVTEAHVSEVDEDYALTLRMIDMVNANARRLRNRY